MSIICQLLELNLRLSGELGGAFSVAKRTSPPPIMGEGILETKRTSPRGGGMCSGV